MGTLGSKTVAPKIKIATRSDRGFSIRFYGFDCSRCRDSKSGGMESPKFPKVALYSFPQF
jgi:hypothetical protein